MPAALSSAARAANEVLSRCAPRDPPVTRMVGHCGSRPKALIPSARRAARSSWETSRRNGIPSTDACGSAVPRKVVATNGVIRAPTRLASPARAFCSWTTMGMRRCRAAR